jgi:geranylgeranyl pyrophosphate synthase
MNIAFRFSPLALRPLIRWSLSGGKRLRALLAILSSESVGGERNRALNLALAIELIHNASLVLDDIIDKDKERRGRLALHEKWSREYAILTAGALISLAMKLAAEYREEVVKLIAQSMMDLCEGEYMDISSSLETVSEEEYLSLVRKKTASLFKLACHCGGLVGGGSPIEVECLSLFGENFGMAYQLRDDLLDLKLSERRIPKDLKTRKSVLPLIHFCNSNLGNRKMLGREFSAMPKDYSIANDYVIKTKMLPLRLEAEGSFECCWEKVNHYVNEAIKSLQPIRNTKFKRYMIQMARSLTCYY